MEQRVYNFSPGPAVLPVAALQEAQRNLLALPGTGMSILEISHRSKTFQAIIDQAEANLRKLLNVPSNYRILFLQGGALLQFAMVPMSLLRGSGRSADYILSGSWAKKALGEAKTQGEARVAWDGSTTEWKRMPKQKELDLSPDAVYVHMTSNETIQGIQFPAEPDVGDKPLVCDSSSDFLSRPLDITKYGILYACAQKNAGPAGVTIVLFRDDLLQSVPGDLPSMLNYKTLADSKSLLNTPPVFGIYMVKLVTDWLLSEIGGLEEMYKINTQKAELLYTAIDQCGGFYDGHAEPDSRSIMNVTFRLPNADLEDKFLKEARTRRLVELKGHRSVGGCRASIYNAMPMEGVQALQDFMFEFCESNT